MEKVHYYIVDRVKDVKALHIGTFDPMYGFTFSGTFHKTVDAWMARLGALGETEMIRATHTPGPPKFHDPSTFYSECVSPYVIQEGKGRTRREYALYDIMETPVGRDIVWKYFKGDMWQDGGFEFATGVHF